MVEPISVTTESQTQNILEKCTFQSISLKSDQVLIDFLTDMVLLPWVRINGQEWWQGWIYAGARSWLRFEKLVHDLTGMPYILPTHQGRAAERILYSHLGGRKDFISNTHFDTTRANIEFSGSTAIDIPIPEAKDFSVLSILSKEIWM